MIISLIAAMGKNRVIGKNNSLPWHLPAEMKFFKETTKNKPVIMGRKTFESIGKPLPNRKNIIITRDQNFMADGCTVVNSVDEALKESEGNEVMIIGGAQIYKEFLSKANKIYLTIIDENFDGDTFFPEYNEDEWEEIKHEIHEPDEENKYKFTILTLVRK